MFFSAFFAREYVTNPSKKYFVLTSKYFKPYLVYYGERVTIGRDRQNSIYVPSNTLSRQHAEVSVSPEGEAFLEDCQSRNGTYLNGIAIQQKVRLQSGDRIKLGGLPVLFEEHIELSEEGNKKDQTVTSIIEGMKFTSSSSEVMGNLRYMDMLEILTTINYFQKSGVLNLRHGDKRGEIYLKEGEILTASFEHIQNIEAVHHMLSMKEGMFVFEPQDKLPETKEVFISIQQIMMEYAYQLDRPQEEEHQQDTFVMDEFPEGSSTTKKFPPSSTTSNFPEEPPTSPI